MDWTTIVTSTFFWFLVLAEMFFTTGLFCAANKDQDRVSVRAENVTVWIVGFALVMPVLQAGQWLHGSTAWAWGLVLGTASLIVLVVVASERRRN